MTDVGLGELVVRMVVSLAIVLAIVLAAYALLRRRQGFASGGGSARRAGASRSVVGRGAGRGSSRGARVGTGRRGLRIVGRVGVSRTSSLVAVQFAERVYLIGASDQTAPTVIAEMATDEWERATEAPEEAVPLSPRGVTPRPGLLDALREATTRRG